MLVYAKLLLKEKKISPRKKSGIQLGINWAWGWGCG